MTIEFPLLAAFRDTIVDAPWNFIGGLQKGGDDVATVNDLFNAGDDQIITGSWSFFKAHISSIFSTTGTFATGNQERKGNYNFTGSTTDRIMELSNSDFNEMRIDSTIWVFRVINLSNVDNPAKLTVQAESNSGVSFDDNGSGKLRVTTSPGHPYTEFTEFKITSSTVGSYNGNHTVTARVSNTQFDVNENSNGSGSGTIRPNLVRVIDGANVESRGYNRHQGNTFWNDGINWMYYEDN